jgi:hypothetical protein
VPMKGVEKEITDGIKKNKGNITFPVGWQQQ